MKRCFIENDLEVDSFDKMDLELITGLNWDDDINMVVVDAARLKFETWKAIKECGEIYISTHFIGASGSLLIEMAQMVVDQKMSNKKVFNLIHKTDIQKWIPDDLLSELEKLNIIFYFREDILSTTQTKEE